MQLEQSFEVEAPLDRVWAALVDVEHVAPCLPGAAVTGRNDDGSYNGTFTIKIGPTTASYTGKLEMRNIDESSHSATMHAHGSDRRGQGGATATISSRLTSSNGTTRVEVVTDYHITGRLARFGRGGMIEDISEKLLREFASRLQASLTHSGEPGATEPTPPVTEQAPAAAPEPVAEAPQSAAQEDYEQDTSEQPTTETAVASVEEAVAPPPTEAVAPPPAHGAAPSPPPPPAHAAAPPPPPPPPPPASEPPPPLDGMSLVGSVLLDRVKRNPAPVIAVVGGIVLLRLVLRRR